MRRRDHLALDALLLEIVNQDEPRLASTWITFSSDDVGAAGRLVPITQQASWGAFGSRQSPKRSKSVTNVRRFLLRCCSARRNHSALFEVARNFPTRPFKAVARAQTPLGHPAKHASAVANLTKVEVD